MFISKITLSEGARTNDTFWTMFGSEYALHQAVWNLFADTPDRRRDFLYRLDTIGKWPVVYTLSRREPMDNSNLWRIETKRFDPQVRHRMRLGFTVRVNPICKRDGKRHDVVMDLKHKTRSNSISQDDKETVAEIVNGSCSRWINERSRKNGFSVLQVRADGYRQIRFNKSKAGMPVRYSTVDLTGVLEVSDESLFTNMLFKGLGPEKGFGCGLMLVRKI